MRRDVYKHGLNYQSSNKHRGKRAGPAEDWRLRRAGEELESLDGRSYPSHVERDAAMWQSRAHNCGELARAARHLGRQFGYEVAVVGGEAHAFAVFGRCVEAELSSDMQEWPGHLAICDPWANIVCLAHEYPDRFAAKMDKWARDRKSVCFNARWIAANQADWMAAVLRGPKPFNA